VRVCRIYANGHFGKRTAKVQTNASNGVEHERECIKQLISRGNWRFVIGAYKRYLN